MSSRKKIDGVWHIRRAPYTRKAYTKSDGTHVKATKVKGSWIVDRGEAGKGKKLFSLKKGLLTKYGYHLNSPVSKRHSALDKAVKAYGKTSTLRKVNALSILQKNTDPKYASTAKSDVRYLEKKYFKK